MPKGSSERGFYISLSPQREILPFCENSPVFCFSLLVPKGAFSLICYNHKVWSLGLMRCFQGPEPLSLFACLLA